MGVEAFPQAGEVWEDVAIEPRLLPSDLPRSLDDRQPVRVYEGETEMYDAWKGQSQFLTNPIPAQPLAISLSLSDDRYDEDQFNRKMEDRDNRLMEMLAAQAAHREDGSAAGDEDSIIADIKLSDPAKRVMLQKSLHMAASNGDVERVRRLVSGSAKNFIDVNGVDEEGTAPLIYASCFGHQDVVSSLLDSGAQVDRQDRNQWTSLMWAITNRHKDIAKVLLGYGASPEIKSSSGRTAFDFAAPNSEISDYLQQNGYYIGDAGIGDDFYDNGFSQDRFEQEMEENEMKRRMMMESSMNLEVDLSSLGMDERPETPDPEEEHQDFVWDKCLHDQMFVFQESELDRILGIIITNITPQRSPTQKPVPANILFLSARYAHYHGSPELLATLLMTAMDKINTKVERHQWDMTVLAFWISNATLLLHYLKKDTGLVEATTEFQVQLVELINEIFILIIRDAERRMDKVLDAAMLDHETIPGFEDVHFANDWNIFRSKNKVPAPEPMGIRPQLTNRRAQPSPRNITSLLSSTLFVLDLYDIHSVITSQILAQLFYWIGAELFNHVLCHKVYLARTKAMQIRMNISVLEDWARANNRSPEHYENGSLRSSGENTIDAARKHLTPVIQLLQWLQCFSSLGEDPNALENTLKQLTRLTPQHLLQSSRNYRCEVGERGIPKSARKRLVALQTEIRKRQEKVRSDRRASAMHVDGDWIPANVPPTSPKKGLDGTSLVASASSLPTMNDFEHEDDIEPDEVLMDPAHMLQFSLPTTVDLRLSYGAGYGGMNRERERKYIPAVPPEFLIKLDISSNSKLIERSDWDRVPYDE